MYQFPMFSRSLTGPGLDGKATEEIKTKGSLELKEKLAGLAALHDMSSSEYVRLVLQAHVYGHMHILRVRSTVPVREDRE